MRSAIAFAVLTLLAGGTARAQCTYPQLSTDVPQAFASTPAIPRFIQSGANWAAVGVKSGGTANWDIGLSLTTAAFPTCVALPVVASQQASGIDFVLGDFATQGTGTRYAPIARMSGTGSASVEWDDGHRVVDLAHFNDGPATPTLLDCWTANLVAGTSYRVWLFGDAPGDYTMYVFRRGGANTWRQRSDAIAVIPSSYTDVPPVVATTTDRYAFVIVNETGTTQPYMFNVQTCTDPPNLESRVSQLVPHDESIYLSPFEFNPDLPGFPTIAVRTPQLNGNLDLTIAKQNGSGFYPCVPGESQTGSGYVGTQVDFVVGDMASGAITPGATYWAGVAGGFSAFAGSRIEYDDGTDSLVVDGPTRLIFGNDDLVVRTYRINLEAGIPYSIHVAKPGVAQGRFHLFRPFDPAFPFGNGWLGLVGDHQPLIKFDVTGINDIAFTPPVTGPYAIVLTNESSEIAGWELGVSTCLKRIELLNDAPRSYAPAALAQPGWQQSFGAVHGRFGWSVVAARAQEPGDDWHLESWRFPTAGGGAPPFGCLSGALGSTLDPGVTSNVDFLARYDLYAAGLETRVQSARVRYGGPAAPAGGVDVEYAQWNSFLVPGDLVQNYPVTPGNIVEVWNVQLAKYQPYAFHFAPSGFNGEVFLMQSVANCTGTCTPEMLAMGGPGQVAREIGDFIYTPVDSGLFGIVVVNQSARAGTFDLGVDVTTVDAESGAPVPGAFATRFRGAAPNPFGAATRFRFDLAKASRVGFEIVNIAGRVVASVAEAPFPGGPGSIAWSPRDGDGRRIAPGLYFARMRVDGEVIDAREKVIVLP